MTLTQADTVTRLTDADLARWALSDREAFSVLYQRYLTPVYRYFYARTGDVQQAEDLTTETFLSILKQLDHYQERGRFAGWLFTIAAHRLADHFRRRPRRPAVPLDDIPVLPDPNPCPEAQTEQAERMAHLVQALQTLSPDRAQAITLHFFGELSLRETAKVMDRSQVAVKSLIHRALRDLRERLDHERE